MRPRRKRRRADPRARLLTQILVLSVVLIAVILMAVNMSGGQEASTGGETQATEETYEYPDALVITEPKETQLLCLEDKLMFRGLSDPGEALSINGIPVQREADGSFAYEQLLALGQNTVTVQYREETTVYSVERRYVVERCSPMDAQDYSSGATVYFEVSARYGSTVQVAFAGQVIDLEADKFQGGADVAEGFALYTGQYVLPNTNLTDQDLGTITYTASCDGLTETYVSGTVTCLKPGVILASDPGATPDYGKYIDVGSGYVAQIVTFAAETFDGATVDDYSHPTNNYLPEGTVDYCSTQEITLGSQTYVVLRSGQRVYVDKRNTPTFVRVPIVDRYIGTLPDHNEIGFVSMQTQGRHTILTLDCLWKAPFYFDLSPQTYQHATQTSDRNYSVTDFTAAYIDITFCYATKFTGTVQLPVDSDLFSRAELTQRDSDCVLRLYLKKSGGFYGWDAYYNDAGQLCFRFLEPAQVTVADNALGADLTGVKVVIDVGHGGSDPGTVREDFGGQDVYESYQNMVLAQKLKQLLSAAGAEVVLTRDGDTRMTVDERYRLLMNEAPDYCISIHHNSLAGYPNWSGFETSYYTPLSMNAAKFINQRTEASGVYQRASLKWHVFFLARQTVCPVILTENGYMSCDAELENILDDAVVETKALALAQGVADYFLSLRQ